MDRKMNEKALHVAAPAPLEDEALCAVSGAHGPMFDFSSLSVLASPVTISQVNVNTPTQVAIGNLGATTLSATSAQGNSASVSYSK